MYTPSDIFEWISIPDNTAWYDRDGNKIRSMRTAKLTVEKLTDHEHTMYDSLCELLSDYAHIEDDESCDFPKALSGVYSLTLKSHTGRIINIQIGANTPYINGIPKVTWSKGRLRGRINTHKSLLHKRSYEGQMEIHRKVIIAAYEASQEEGFCTLEIKVIDDDCMNEDFWIQEYKKRYGSLVLNEKEGQKHK